MRAFKKLYCVLLLAAFLTSLTGCIIIPRRAHYDIDEERLRSVQIYDLRNSDNHNSTLLEKETPVYELTQEQTANFVSELEGLSFDNTLFIVLAAVDPSFNYGDWVARINYDDGEHILISSWGYGATYDGEGNVISSNHYSYDDEEWEQFIKSYLPADVYSEQAES